MNKHKKYIIYARLACKEQSKGISMLDNQAEVLNDYAAKNKLHVVDTISEYGSGTNSKLPGIQRLLKKLLNGEAEGVICTRRDRLSRKIIQYFKYKKMFKEKNIDLITIYEPAFGPESELIADFQLAFATWESKIHSDRIKAALAYKKSLQST